MTKIVKSRKQKNFKQAPLPFQGQKKRFLKSFKEALTKFPVDAVYVDLFGGSGLLAHTVKQEYPDARVIWNDFDNYKKRLENIPNTNSLLEKLRENLAPYPRDQKITGSKRQEVIQIISSHEETTGYVDFVSMSASLLFGGNYSCSLQDFKKKGFYNRIRLSNFEETGFLDNVERIQQDYKIVHQDFKGKNTVFLVDPPYLSTDVSTYNKEEYWRLTDYLDVLSVLDNSSYFYFTSNKSQIVELCEWIETRTLTGNPFQGATSTTTNNHLNYQSSYTDIMLYKPASE